MSMTLYNPTDEDFNEMEFGGRGYPLPSGKKIKVEDPCGKHLINAFAQRGLCSLEYDDDEKAIGAAGIQRNLAFKKRMVVQHNRRNVYRKTQGMSYTEPSMIIRRYAEELGLTLDEPYAVKDKENERMALLEKQNSDLNETVKALMGQVKELLSQDKPQMEVKKEPFQQQRK